MKNYIACLFFMVIISLISSAYAEDDMAGRWRSMNKRERDSYALGVRDTLAVMCMMTSENKKEYLDCVKKYASAQDMPNSLFKIFDDSYSKKLYNNVTSDVLIYIWAHRDSRDVKKDLEKAEKAAKKMRFSEN